MVDNRKGIERRQKPTPLFNRYLLKGSRIDARRSDDLQQKYYVDRFKTVEWISILLLFFLCVADAILTIIHLKNGCLELNPILNVFYRYGGFIGFLAIKFGLTLPCIVFLFLHIKYPLAQKGIITLFTIYSILLLYQFKPFLFSS